MRKIPKHELEKYLAQRTSPRRTALFRTLEELEVGEAMEFKKE